MFPAKIGEIGGHKKRQAFRTQEKRENLIKPKIRARARTNEM